MKKEWMYFIAGAGIGVIIFFTMSAEHSTYYECVLKEMQKMPEQSGNVHPIVWNYCKEKYG